MYPSHEPTCAEPSRIGEAGWPGRGAGLVPIANPFEPQPDGTLRGVATTTALTNECGNQGTVWRTPIVVTRTGDVPPTITVADPALFEAPTAPATDGPH
jgi:serine/threonine protein kinase, bacterial